MGHVYRNLQPIPIPKDCYVAKEKKRVHRYYYLNGVRKYHVVGHLTDDGLMIPNDVFRTHFPKEWNEAYGEALPAARELKAGMYGLVLGIGVQTGLYGTLQDAFGPRGANILMDLAMHLVVHHGQNPEDPKAPDAPVPFEKAMENRVCFSKNALDPGLAADFWAAETTAPGASRFRELWLAKSVGQGRKAVWLCILNMENGCRASRPASFGDGAVQSQNEASIGNVLLVLDAMDGRPVAWFAGEGGASGSEEPGEVLDGALRHLDRAGLDVQGVLVDAGPATQKVLHLLAERGLEYIALLEKTSQGFVQMLERHRDELFMNIGLSLDADDAVFGLVDRARLFSDSRDEAHVALCFSPKDGMESSLALLKSIRTRGRRLRSQGASADARPAGGIGNVEDIGDTWDTGGIGDSSKVARFLSSTTSVKGEVEDMAFNPDEFRAATRAHGYFALASSRPWDADTIFSTWRLGAPAKIQLGGMKTMPWLCRDLVFADNTATCSMLIVFVSSILRNEIENACRELDLDTDRTIAEVDSIRLGRVAGGEYEPMCDWSEDTGLLLARFGVRADHFKVFAEELNCADRDPDAEQVRQLPDLDEPRRRGRRKGSKNRKTLEREALEAELRARGELPEKRGPGRPKGSKNRKTLACEALEAEMAAKGQGPAKRGPGRPKGSKNRKTLEREALEAEMRAMAGRGRPKGSKNRETLMHQARKERAARKNAQKEEAARLAREEALSRDMALPGEDAAASDPS